MCGAAWAAPERLTLCLRGRESQGGRHGGVGEPAQENGVQGESSARWPPGARPPLPLAPGGAWPDSAQCVSAGRRPSAVLSRLCGPSPEMLVALCRSPCSAAGEDGGAATVNKGAEPRPPATCRLPSSLRLEFETVCGAV